MYRIVLLPGMNGTANLLADFVDQLGPEFETTVVEYPADERLGYDDLEAIARSYLPAKGSYFLLGESFSGPIAIAIAASAPRGLRGLVLCCSFVKAPTQFPKAIGALSRLVWFRWLPDSTIAKYLLGSNPTRALKARVLETIGQIPSATIAKRIESVLKVDVSDEATRIAVPVLCLTGTNDKVVARSASSEIAHLVEKARMEELPGPHLLLQVSPAESARIVSEFCRDEARSSD